MSFRYPLQKIVDLKVNEKTQAEWILSHAMGVLQEEELSLQSLNSEKSEIHADLTSAVGTSANISQLRTYQNYMTHLDSRITKKLKDVEHAEQNVLHKKGHLSAKMIDEKVWSKAKDKAKMIFDAVARTKEQQVLDEMATTRHKYSS
ncbi:flagellar export protein FliJ [Paenibacillus psychroresistens]|uniref:flagellar export protein FliJ n=1 Tax=Paenibacillus psychroresistens TaxID=1778678 RepID=UPI0013918B9B|nr:flagellar export protein FliJ [Paenibacillus psychroresistens]